MISARAVPPLDCANDVGGQCAPRPSGDAHLRYGGSRCTAASCGSPPRPAVAGRAERTGTGATPPSDAPVVAWARVCLRTPRPRRGRSRPWIPAGRLVARWGSGPSFSSALRWALCSATRSPHRSRSPAATPRSTSWHTTTRRSTRRSPSGITPRRASPRSSPEASSSPSGESGCGLDGDRSAEAGCPLARVAGRPLAVGRGRRAAPPDRAPRERRGHPHADGCREGERLPHRPSGPPRARRQDPQRRTARHAKNRPQAPPQEDRRGYPASGVATPASQGCDRADRAVRHRWRLMMAPRTKRRRRSYSAGEWGRNRVRVFPDSKTGLIQIEWREAGRRRSRSLGHRDWDRAKRQADEVAAGPAPEEMSRKRHQPNPRRSP